MARKSNAVAALQVAAVQTINTDTDLNPNLRAVVESIDTLFSNAQTSSLQAFWHIGRHISNVAKDPDQFLTAEQKAAQIDPTNLIMAVFAPVYSAEQLRSAEAFYVKYPTDRELQRLLNMRNEDNPRWRLSASHVQLLTQIADDKQRAAVEEKCVEEALTAKALAQELHEIRGKKSGGGRKHEAPKGLKNKLHDLLQHLRRFTARSETLWLADEGLYDQFMNTPPAKREGAPQAYFDEIAELLTKVSDVVGDHIAMVNKVLEAQQDAAESDDQEEEESSDMAANARRAAAAAAASRRKGNITR